MKWNWVENKTEIMQRE